MAKPPVPETVEHILNYHVDEIINRPLLAEKLRSGQILRIKLGVDPTKPDLHFGHAVVLWKLKEFQDAGHIVIFLIGDYTTRIGDPSGRNTTRPILSAEEIEQNAQTYLAQVGKILDIKKCELRRNSEWFETMTFADIIKLLGQVTVAQIIDREDFQTRLRKGLDVGMHEVIYPIMQGYDSVQLKCDVEIGGIDQKLNMLMGRDLQRKFGQDEQAVMIMPLLLGLDGAKKMSKSLDNYIGINEPPAAQFGKIMSLPDNLMMDYWELCTPASSDELAQIKQELADGTNPRDIKLRLAKAIVALYHNQSAAEAAEAEFINTFQKGELPKDMPMVKIPLEPISVVDLLVATGLVDSKSEGKRMIDQKAVKIDQQLISDPDQKIDPQVDMVLQVGKRKFAKLS